MHHHGGCLLEVSSCSRAVYEQSNSYYPNAVAIHNIDGQVVSYLARSHARVNIDVFKHEGSLGSVLVRVTPSPEVKMRRQGPHQLVTLGFKCFLYRTCSRNDNMLQRAFVNLNQLLRYRESAIFFIEITRPYTIFIQIALCFSLFRIWNRYIIMSLGYVSAIYFGIRSLVRHLPNTADQFTQAFPT